MKPAWPNMINIFGCGRNVGKTTFACGLIKHLSTTHPIVAIKISPHFHNSESELGILFKTEQYIISEETNSTSGKDTARMKSAGASKVFFIQCKDNGLKEAFEKLISYLPTQSPIVCESASIQKIVNPGYSIKMIIPECDANKNFDIKEDQTVIFESNEFSIQPENFIFQHKLKLRTSI